MADITTSLMGNNLFNLTDTPLTVDIQHWINKRGKYNPHVQKPIHHRLKQFVVSFYQCVNKIFKRSNFRRKVIQGTSTIPSDLNKFKLANPTSSDLITSIQGSYTSKRRQFKNHLKQIHYSKKNETLISDQALSSHYRSDDS